MKTSKRHHARECLVQALYQREIAEHSLTELLIQFECEHEQTNMDKKYFGELLPNIIEHIADIDEALQQYCDRPLKDLTPIELCVLRLATYELMHRVDIPYRVVINEALELTKSFGTVEGFKYVNGVLDKLAQQVRSDEM